MEMSAGAADSPMSGGAAAAAAQRPSRYESQKRRDWQTFGQYLRNHRPPLELSRCSGAHVLEFLRYLDQFGKTKVHAPACPFFGHPSPPAPCPCPLKQAWGSLDALVGRLRAAFEEHGGMPEANPFGARAVRLYLRDVRDTQAKARGIAYEKKRRRRNASTPANKQQAAAAKLQQDPCHHHHHHHHQAPGPAKAERRRDVHVLEPPPPQLRHIFRGAFMPAAADESAAEPPVPPSFAPFFLRGPFFVPATDSAGPGPAPAVGVTAEDMALATAEAQPDGWFMPMHMVHHSD